MKKLVNHFNSITKNTKARPVLSQVNFNSETQWIECTDSHRLLQVKPNEPIEHTYNLNLTTLEMNNSAPYPDLSRLIITKGVNEFELLLSTINKECLKLLKIYKNEHIQLSIENDRLQFKVEGTQQPLFALPIITTKKPEDFDMYFNPLHLFDCLNFLLETQRNNVTVYYNGNNRPIQFTLENQFNYLITPLRKK